MFRRITKSKTAFLVKRHKDYQTKSKYKQNQFLEELETTPELYLQTKYTKSSQKFLKMASDVGREIHYHKMFTRLKIESVYLLSGVLEAEHYIEDLLLKFFYNRFPNYCVILESINKKKTFYIAPTQLKENIADLSGLRNIEVHNTIIGVSKLNRQKVVNYFFEILKSYKDKYDIMEKALNPEELFKSFYDSQYIASRKNLKLFNKNMPKKYQKKRDMKVERSFQTKSIDDYLNSEESG